MILDNLSLSSVSNGEDTKSICSDNTSINSEYSGGDNSISNDNRQRRKKRSNLTAQTINYHGINIYQAAQKGNLPICVLLWGMGSSKRINLMVPDIEGNNPMHYAALADNAEVISFFLQQTKGYLTNELKLVDSKNHLGETPLLRAMSIGIPIVIKTLVDESSDPLVIDQRGNSIFSVLAKHGHFWCMNYVYHLVHKKYGTHVALELMSALDNEVHCSLDWAADTGDVNTIEFLIRKGLTPLRVDNLNRSPLYWAVKRNRLKATKFLVKCGCDPEFKDTTGVSPLAIAKQMNNPLLLEALQVSKKTKESYNHWKSYVETELAWTSINNPQYGVIEEVPPLFYLNSINDKKESFAIDREYQTSKLTNATIYGCLVIVLGFMPLFVPFYIYTILLGIVGYVVIIVFGQREIDEVDQSEEYSNIPTSSNYYLEDILYARERGLGLWMGGMTVYFVYILCAFINYYIGINSNSHHSFIIDHKSGFYIYSPSALGGFSMVKNNTSLYWLVVSIYTVCVYLWIRVVWVDVDPGIVDTRDEDFEEVMTQSLATLGPPPMHLYCRTTLVKKPLRSKYCTSKGYVVARMDHYCIWLNTTIGYGNHRLFMLFLISHFLLEVPLSSTCEVLSALLSGKYFFVLVLVMFFAIASIALGLLSIEQLGNMARNITTNERINLLRYSYLEADPYNGSLDNKFDRGIIHNILEFWQVPGYALDYMSVFELPNIASSQSSSLTQENIQLILSKNTSLHSNSKNNNNNCSIPLSSPSTCLLEESNKNHNNTTIIATNTVVSNRTNKDSNYSSSGKDNNNSSYNDSKKELLGLGVISSSSSSSPTIPNTHSSSPYATTATTLSNTTTLNISYNTTTSNVTKKEGFKIVISNGSNNTIDNHSNVQYTTQQLMKKKLIDDINNTISNNSGTSNNNNDINNTYSNNNSNNHCYSSSSKANNYNLLNDVEDIEMNIIREHSIENTESFL